jgi:hypothetical protein
MTIPSVAPVIPLTPAIARLLAGPDADVTAHAVVGGSVCIRAIRAYGVEEFYFRLAEAETFALELADAIEMAVEFLKEGRAGG